MTFNEKLRTRINTVDSLLCVGLDPSPALYKGGGRTPAHAALAINRRTIEATLDLACCYKPNIAFYEALGLPGLGVLTETLAMIPDDVPVLLDAKRADVGSTSEAYVRYVFDVLNVDAVTVNPYLGGDAVMPFIERREKGVFVLCRTSNPGARDLQDLLVDGEPLYRKVGRLAMSWNSAGNVHLVMGATYPQELAWARQEWPDAWFLVPGVGAQGGDLAAAVAAGSDAGGSGLIVAASRAIMGANDPRQAANELRLAINEVRRQKAPGAAVGTVESSELEELAVGLYDAGCVQFGEFTLKSGKSSPVYLDLRRLVGSAALMRLAARAYARALAPLHFDRLAAIPYAGLPIGTAVAVETGKPLIYPRREVKAYGAGKAIEGAFAAGETVAIIDDVVTTGATKHEAMAPLLAAGLQVQDVVVLVDREQGGPADLAAAGLRLHSIFTMSSLLDVLARRNRVNAESVARVRAYLAAEAAGA